MKHTMISFSSTYSKYILLLLLLIQSSLFGGPLHDAVRRNDEEQTLRLLLDLYHHPNESELDCFDCLDEHQDKPDYLGNTAFHVAFFSQQW